jgi:superfamily II DNA or RNA helicase
MITLRPYQSEGIEKIRNSYRNGNKRPLFVLATGAGKTLTFSYITMQSVNKGLTVWVMAHKDDLIGQISESLQRFQIRHGIIQGGRYVTPNLNCYVVSIPTIARRLGKYPAPDLIIIDEAHHSTAGNYVKILDYYPNAKVLGVTATPCRSDGRGLGDVFDDMIIGPTVYELINGGYLVMPRYYNPKSESLETELKSVKKLAGDYNNKDLAEAVKRAALYGDIITNYREKCGGVPAVVFCVNVEHANEMARRFSAAGFTAANVDGTMDKTEVREILRKLGTGEIQVVTSCNLISEGTDIPAIGCAILARPTQSLSLYLQQVGRALRPFGGKDYAIILDHANNFGRFGHPVTEREWSLSGEKTKSRKSDEERLPDALPTSHCKACGFVWLKKDKDDTRCPDCGHETKPRRNLEEVSAELVEIEFRPEPIEKKKNTGFRAFWPKQSETYPEFHALEILFQEKKQKNYKNGWILFTFTARIMKVKDSGNVKRHYGVEVNPMMPDEIIQAECKKHFDRFMKTKLYGY